LGVIMICICEPRDASARSLNRLRSVHTIMIFVVPASTDHFLWTMAIKTPIIALCQDCGLPPAIFRSHVVPYLDRDWCYAETLLDDRVARV
jgi:hypothetical protein